MEEVDSNESDGNEVPLSTNQPIYKQPETFSKMSKIARRMPGIDKFNKAVIDEVIRQVEKDVNKFNESGHGFGAETDMMAGAFDVGFP